MFIALIIPAARKSVAVLCVIGAAVAVTCILKYIPVFGFISSGFRVILATIAASALGARLFPSDEYGEEKEDGQETAAAPEITEEGGVLSESDESRDMRDTDGAGNLYSQGTSGHNFQKRD